MERYVVFSVDITTKFQVVQRKQVFFCFGLNGKRFRIDFIYVLDLLLVMRPSVRLEGSNMIFHSLTFARSRGKC